MKTYYEKSVKVERVNYATGNKYYVWDFLEWSEIPNMSAKEDISIRGKYLKYSTFGNEYRFDLNSATLLE